MIDKYNLIKSPFFFLYFFNLYEIIIILKRRVVINLTGLLEKLCTTSLLNNFAILTCYLLLIINVSLVVLWDMKTIFFSKQCLNYLEESICMVLLLFYLFS